MMQVSMYLWYVRTHAGWHSSDTNSRFLAQSNNRGNAYGLRHKTLSNTSAAFWNFSFTEMAMFDLPANVQAVLSITGRSTLSYVGHSEGTMQAFIGFGNADLAAKVSVYVALSPVAYIGNITSTLLQIIAKLHTESIFEIFGANRFLPSETELSKLMPDVCHIRPQFCENVMCAIMGCDKQDWNQTRFEVYMSLVPSGTSVKNIVHFAQLVRSATYQQFDYGKDGNMKQYGQPTPPDFDISDLKVPVALFTGGHDDLADPKDVDRLLAVLPPKFVLQVHSEPSYSHLDPIWGLSAATQIYPLIIDIINAHLASQN
jgi:pimeloyl-ACP methyl ester carboxylesterase